MKFTELVSCLFISLALVSIGFLGSDGLKRFSSGNRVVSVKGVSKREVEADMAYWSLRHVAKASTVDEARANLRESQKKSERVSGKAWNKIRANSCKKD
jgi:uncharacterized protein